MKKFILRDYILAESGFGDFEPVEWDYKFGVIGNINLIRKENNRYF